MAHFRSKRSFTLSSKLFKGNLYVLCMIPSCPSQLTISAIEFKLSIPWAAPSIALCWFMPLKSSWSFVWKDRYYLDLAVILEYVPFRTVDRERENTMIELRWRSMWGRENSVPGPICPPVTDTLSSRTRVGGHGNPTTLTTVEEEKKGDVTMNPNFREKLS